MRAVASRASSTRGRGSQQDRKESELTILRARRQALPPQPAGRLASTALPTSNRVQRSTQLPKGQAEQIDSEENEGGGMHGQRTQQHNGSRNTAGQGTMQPTSESLGGQATKDTYMQIQVSTAQAILE